MLELGGMQGVRDFVQVAGNFVGKSKQFIQFGALRGGGLDALAEIVKTDHQ